MTDIVERLRDREYPGGHQLMVEAADEIERLRAEVKTLRNELGYMTATRNVWRAAYDEVAYCPAQSP